VTTDFSGSGRVALQADGKVVAVGNVPGFGGNSDLALARYNADGSLDRSFGVNGKQITDVDWGGDDRLAGDRSRRHDRDRGTELLLYLLVDDAHCRLIHPRRLALGAPHDERR
jgi:hypothetical protein